MTPGARCQAAIEILQDFFTRRVPLKVALADWARGARYAGAKDRAWISGLCLDTLRKKNTLADVMGNDNPRALVLAAVRFAWNTPLETLADWAAHQPHGPGALSDQERTALATDELPVPQTHDIPDWSMPHLERAFGPDTQAAIAALSERADIDLRVNTLKSTPEKAATALKTINAEPVPLLDTALRIPAPPASQRAPSVTVIPAFNKGWIEVQDLGSQLAASAAGDITGKQVLDLCAGGGGKTLALAALMENTGQLYAYDNDPHRLKPLFERAKRAGVRNLQIRSPAGGETTDDLTGKMDVVFIDAPCTGAGTWRRHPDTKWRLTRQQLETRMAEQDAVLAAGAKCVKPGGRLVWVTCSPLKEENEDRLEVFLRTNQDFRQIPTLPQIAATGLLTQAGHTALEACATPDGALRLAPHLLRADGFFIAVLERVP